LSHQAKNEAKGNNFLLAILSCNAFFFFFFFFFFFIFFSATLVAYFIQMGLKADTWYTLM